MSKTTGKRAFIASQPAAAISALDFAAASQSFQNAIALCDRQIDEEDIAACADAAWDKGDHLLGLRALTPLAIAEKVEAFHYLHHRTRGQLRDPATQMRIAGGNDDAAKGLLAIYLDLLSLEPRQDRTAWEQAEREYRETEAELARQDHTIESEEAADNAHIRAFGTLVRSPAPDATASAFKMQAILDHAYAEEQGDKADNPAFLQRLVTTGGIDEGWPLVYVFQDAIRQSGDTASPLLAVSRPVPPAEGGPRL